MISMRIPTLAALVPLMVGGCFGNETTAFPDGLMPLEEARVDPPSPTDGDPHPEEVRLISGETSRFEFAHARGYVHASLPDVFAALQTPEVVIDRRGVDRYSVTHDVEPDYPVSFVVHNEVDDVITVEFDVTWRMGIVEGGNDTPMLVAATFSKTWGTTIIGILRGSILARYVEPEVTELELVEHLDAPGGIGPVVAYLQDVHANVVAHVRGEPLPPL
jgi:hypothetical protein